MPGALDGITVLDLSRVVAGPTCAMMLGDLGADVIKVERPSTGDDARAWGPPFRGTESAYYLGLNRNKRSLTLDLKSERGRDILLELAADADVLVENFRTGTTERMGISYDDLRAINPGLVYCSVSGYGRTGPDADRPGYDFVIQGRGGFMSITGERDGPPMKVGLPVIDVLAALNAAVGILAALYHRSITGEGQFLDVSLLDAEVSSLVNPGSNFLIGGSIPGRWGNANPNIVPYQAVKAKDKWFTIAVGNNTQFARLCSALGAPEMASDPRFASNAKRVENRGALVEAMFAHLKERPAAEWLAILRREDVPADPIQDISEVFADPQVLAREMLVTIPHPTLGEVRSAGSALKLSETPVHYTRHPPLLGEHTEEILASLGHTQGQISALRKEGVV